MTCNIYLLKTFRVNFSIITSPCPKLLAKRQTNSCKIRFLSVFKNHYKHQPEYDKHYIIEIKVTLVMVNDVCLLSLKAIYFNPI